MRPPRINVGFFSPVLPHYRLSVFAKLAQTNDLDLTVYYSDKPPYWGMKTVEPHDLFPTRKVGIKAIKLGRHEFLYQEGITEIVSKGLHDVIVLNSNPRLLSNFPAIYVARRRKIGVVWWGLGLMPNQSAVTLAVRRWLMRIPDAVALYTKRGRDYFVAHGVPPEKVFVAQNSIDVSDCLAESSLWNEQRLLHFQSTNGIAGRKVLLYCARLKKWKRLDLLLVALGALVKDDPSYFLVVIGDGKCKDEFQRFAHKLGLNRNILWLGSIYEQSKLAPWFLSAKALVNPEVLGLTVFHSFAYGLPCVTCDSSRHQAPEAEAVRHEWNGLLFKQGNIEDLKACIKRICTDEALLSRLRKNAKTTVVEEYSVEKMVDGFVQAIFYAAQRASCPL